MQRTQELRLVHFSLAKVGANLATHFVAIVVDRAGCLRASGACEAPHTLRHFGIDPAEHSVASLLRERGSFELLA